MHPLSYDPIDGFRVLFGDGTVILDGTSLPLGASAVEVLNLSEDALLELSAAARELYPEVVMLLSGPDATGAALAGEALEKFWDILCRYPVYRNLKWDIDTLPGRAREYSQLLDSMLTKGTEDNAAMTGWLARLRGLADVGNFQRHAAALLDRAFTDLPERSASAYASRLTGYYQILDLESQVMSDELDDMEGEEFRRTREENFREMDYFNFPHSFPIRVSYRAVPHPKKEGEYLLAEEVFFQNTETFLSMDLLRGLAAGHLPRRCDNCGRWFLLTSGYDTRYCENPAPGETDGKTCRQVGAHRKEKLLNGTVEIRKQYQRVSNRLKGQKYRKTLSGDEWNRLMKQVQDLRDEALAGRITVADLISQYDQISMRRK